MDVTWDTEANPLSRGESLYLERDLRNTDIFSCQNVFLGATLGIGWLSGMRREWGGILSCSPSSSSNNFSTTEQVRQSWNHSGCPLVLFYPSALGSWRELVSPKSVETSSVGRAGHKARFQNYPCTLAVGLGRARLASLASRDQWILAMQDPDALCPAMFSQCLLGSDSGPRWQWVWSLDERIAGTTRQDPLCGGRLERGGSECVWRSVTQFPWLAAMEEEKAPRVCLLIKRPLPHEAGVKVSPLWVTPEGTPCARAQRRGLVDFPPFPSMILCVIRVGLVTQAALLLFLSSNPFCLVPLHHLWRVEILNQFALDFYSFFFKSEVWYLLISRNPKHY